MINIVIIISLIWSKLYENVLQNVLSFAISLTFPQGDILHLGTIIAAKVITKYLIFLMEQSC